MARRQRTADERVADLQAKIAQAKKRLGRLQTQEAVKQRRAHDHAKFVCGALILAAVELGKWPPGEVDRLEATIVDGATRPRDAEVVQAAFAEVRRRMMERAAARQIAAAEAGITAVFKAKRMAEADEQLPLLRV